MCYTPGGLAALRKGDIHSQEMASQLYLRGLEAFESAERSHLDLQLWVGTLPSHPQLTLCYNNGLSCREICSHSFAACSPSMASTGSRVKPRAWQPRLHGSCLVSPHPCRAIPTSGCSAHLPLHTSLCALPLHSRPPGELLHP